MSQSETMSQIVAELQRNQAEALEELSELEHAVREIGLGAHRLTAAVREIADEAQQLAAASSTSSERQQALANYARHVSTTAAAQAAALDELRRGIEGWGL
jgi:hypothetical protein